MRFTVECYENPDAFQNIWTEQTANKVLGSALRLVQGFEVEAESAQGAADEAFAIANAPWNPEDALGQTWDHTRVRSMSSGDVVVVHTPDGPVGYVCLFAGWTTVEPWLLKIAAN